MFGWLLLALGALDLRAFYLPNELTGALAVSGVLTGIASLQPELVERLIGGVAGFLGLVLAASAYRVIRGVDGLAGAIPSCSARSGCGSGGGCCRWRCSRRA